MSKFRPRLARYNTVCCDQVMPVPVIPVCAVSCCLPTPRCQLPPNEGPCPPQVPGPCDPPPAKYEAAPMEHTVPAFKIMAYCPGMCDPPTGSILTNTTGSVPAGYLLCDGSEISRTTYANLYAVIGSFYGDGDGSTTFNLPNLTAVDPANITTYIIKT